MQPRSAGQNVTQAVQNSFERGLIGQGAGRIQQSSISSFGAPHDLGALLSAALIRRPYHTLNRVSVIRVTNDADAELRTRFSRVSTEDLPNPGFYLIMAMGSEQAGLNVSRDPWFKNLPAVVWLQKPQQNQVAGKVKHHKKVISVKFVAWQTSAAQDQTPEAV